jgi:GTPase KRas protein
MMTSTVKLCVVRSCARPVALAFLLTSVCSQMGDGGTGKTASTIQFVANHFVEMYDPTIEDSYKRHIDIDGEQFVLDILDTAGQDDFSPLRDQWIRESTGFLLIFSLTERKTLEYLETILAQIRRTKEDSPSVPIVLAGNKSDLVASRQVSAAEAQAWARDHGIATFVEMSAKSRTNVTETFQTLVRMVAADELAAAKGGKKQKKKKQQHANAACTVL